MSRRGKLTKKFTAGWLPSDTRQQESDGAIPGFNAVLHPSGKLSFHLMFRDRSGKQRKHTFETNDVDAARIEALELLARIGKGDLPTPEIGNRKPETGDSLIAVARTYVEHKKAKGWRSERYFMSSMENYVFPTLGSRPFEAIRFSDYRAVVEAVPAKHPHAAHTVALNINALVK